MLQIRNAHTVVSTAERYYTTAGREFCTVGDGCFADKIGFRHGCGCGCGCEAG